jgi:DNA-binding transcriptional LysR family regulator
MDRLQSMRVFQQVVDEGGFAAAARKLGLDPAVVSRLVRDLEAHLGARLLQRTTRRLALTAAGDDYLSRLRTILADIDEADAQLRDQARALAGRLRILAPPVVATHILAPAVASFHQRYPDIVLEVRVADLPEPPLEEYDLTLLSGAVPLPADTVVRPVTQSDAVFCAAPAYLQRHGVPKAPQDLAGHRVLRLRASGAKAAPIRLFDEGPPAREHLLDVPAVLLADHTDTLLRATLDGAGISSQPEDILAPFLHAGTLRRVLAPWITNRLSLVAAFPTRKYLPLRTRVFLEHLVAHTAASRARVAGPKRGAPPRVR